MTNVRTLQNSSQRSLLSKLTISMIVLLIMSTTSKINGQTLCQSTSGAFPVPLIDFGQSVTMTGCTGGYFHSFAFEKQATTGITANITIFNGVSTASGDIIYQQSTTIPDAAGTPAITLSGGTGTLAFTANNQYTFRFETSAGVNTIVSPSDNYAGGSFINEGNPDNSAELSFELYTIASNPLPVELSHFNGYESNSNINLFWETEMEINNAGFYIQRTTSGTDWSDIGFVDGNGTTNDNQEYSFIDNELVPGNTYYYRLQQVDFDEKYDYSDVISIAYELTSRKQISVYPNPVVNDLNIINVTENGIVNIFNSLGQIVKNQYINEYQSTINLQDLSNGIYFVQIQLDNGTSTVKQIVKK